MKKYKKFIRTLITALLVVVMAFGAVACGGDNGGNGDNGSVTVTPLPPSGDEGGIISPISLSKNSLNLIVGDITEPIVSSTVGVTWTSLDESIATVKKDASGNGIVEAINEGTTKIVAQYGRASATCDVTVAFDESLPSISGAFNNSDENVKALAKGGTFNFEPTISYRQRVFNDGEFEYSVNDTSLATIDKTGVLTINSDVPTDSTVIVTVKGSWRGKTIYDSTELVRDYSFKIIDDVFIALNGVDFNEMELYMTDSFEGATFVNTRTFTTTVLLNGQEVENAIVDREISNEEEGFIEYNESTNTYTGKKFGSGVITLTYYYDNGVDAEPVPVSTQIVYRVLRPYATLSDTVNYFSGISGLAKDDRAAGQLVEKDLAQFIYGGDSEEIITDAEIVDDLLSSDQRKLTVSENKVLGLNYAADKVVEREIKVGFENAVWYVNLKVYGLYITKASDFDYFVLNKANQKINAYVELGCNIDASNFEMREHFVGATSSDTYLPTANYTEDQAPGFTGVFQGNGYTVTGMSTGLYGLFGAMTNATIKNVGFKNCEIDGAAFLTDTINRCSLENVYIDVAKMSRLSRSQTHTVAGSLVNYGSFKNVQVVNSLINKNPIEGKFAFAPIDSNKLPTFENVFVISSLELSSITLSDEINLNDIGLRILGDIAAFVADEEAQAIAKLFSKNYWTLAEGILTWGSSNIQVADGEIFIDLGVRANKPVDGLTAQRIRAAAGEVELPVLSSYGWTFQGYEVVGTGEKITKNAQGKYVFNFSGNGTIVRAIWKQKSNTTTTPIF